MNRPPSTFWLRRVAWIPKGATTRGRTGRRTGPDESPTVHDESHKKRAKTHKNDKVHKA